MKRSRPYIEIWGWLWRHDACDANSLWALGIGSDGTVKVNTNIVTYWSHVGIWKKITGRSRKLLLIFYRDVNNGKITFVMFSLSELTSVSLSKSTISAVSCAIICAGGGGVSSCASTCISCVCSSDIWFSCSFSGLSVKYSF